MPIPVASRSSDLATAEPRSGRPDSALWGGQARGRNGAITRVVKRHCDRGVGEELPTAKHSPRFPPTVATALPD